MNLKDKILDVMKADNSYSAWGWSIMGYREISSIINEKPISVSNSMRAMERKGILTLVGSKDRWDDTKFELKGKNN